MPPDADASAVMAEIGRACLLPSGEPWPMRAASHVGRPIRCGGDLFGADVNLVARLCAAAEPGQLLLSHATDGSREHLDLRGVAAPVPVVRQAIS
jgi:class 3 adenylate cyclase